ncbi:MAG: beta-ketoacyl-ACP synthase II [Candidatus Gastranaerophilales bacterium]|nr:beta-ketoacyl-ACP synthase II [Candidatus Gastranaerophilales bacterium]
MEKRRVVVTGMGVVSPFGVGMEKFWSNLIAGNSGVRTLQSVDIDKHLVKIGAEVPDFNPEEYIDAKEAKRMDRFTQFAIVAADEAVKDSGLNLEEEDLTKIGVISGSGAGGFITIEKNHKAMLEKGFTKCSPFTVPMLISNMAAGKISIKFGIKGPNKSVVSACATGAHSVGDAVRIIQYGDADVMIAGGTEAIICDMGMGAFTCARTLSRHNDEPQKASRPYDKDRDGFVMGEGSGMLVLEELEHAKKRGAKIYAEVAGYGQSSDAYDPVAPDPEGKGVELAIKNALRDADLKPEDVQYINTHGTSTHLGDIAESQIIAKVFGDKDANKNLLVSSTKSMTGHMIGGTGSAESIVCIKAISEGIVPPTINLDNQDEEVANLDYVPHKSRKHEVKVAMNNSFGFGGCNAVLIFKKYEG